MYSFGQTNLLEGFSALDSQCFKALLQDFIIFFDVGKLVA